MAEPITGNNLSSLANQGRTERMVIAGAGAAVSGETSVVQGASHAGDTVTLSRTAHALSQATDAQGNRIASFEEALEKVSLLKQLMLANGDKAMAAHTGQMPADLTQVLQPG